MNMSELNSKWESALENKGSSFSITNDKGDKTTVKKEGFSFRKALTTAWMALSLTTVAVSALTVHEWMDRMDHIKAGIASGTIDTSKEAVDTVFFVERGANLQDSFIGVKDKIINNIKSAVGMEEPEAQKVENNGMAKNLMSFIKNEQSDKSKPENQKKFKV